MVRRILLSACALLIVGVLSAQTYTLDCLSKEGARIGRMFRNATKANDVDAQNAALTQIDEILATLKTQEQVDALTNAFNNTNVEITIPEQDAVAYVRALGNARIALDEIGIEDAQDIIEKVKSLYLERDADQYVVFKKYLDVANRSLEIGILARNAYGDEVVIKNVNEQLSALKNEFAADSVSLKIVDDVYGYVSPVITNVEYDAQMCAEKMIEARKNGSKEAQRKVSTEIMYFYQRYSIEKGEVEAGQFQNLVNEIIEK